MCIRDRVPAAVGLVFTPTRPLSSNQHHPWQPAPIYLLCISYTRYTSQNKKKLKKLTSTNGWIRNSTLHIEIDVLSVLLTNLWRPVLEERRATRWLDGWRRRHWTWRRQQLDPGLLRSGARVWRTSKVINQSCDYNRRIPVRTLVLSLSMHVSSTTLIRVTLPGDICTVAPKWYHYHCVTSSLAVRPHATLAICVLSLALAGVAALFGTPVTSPSKGAAS